MKVLQYPKSKKNRTKQGLTKKKIKEGSSIRKHPQILKRILAVHCDD